MRRGSEVSEDELALSHSPRPQALGRIVGISKARARSVLEDTVASLGDGVGVVFVSNAKLTLDDELPHDSIWSVDSIAMYGLEA